jgi:hypothetical protein
MSDIKLTNTGDIDITNASLSLTNEDNAESLAQRIKIKLSMFQGEWFLNTDFGVPYFQKIFVKGTNKAKIDAIFKEQIKSVPGVDSITKYNSSINGNTRSFTLDFEVMSTFGVQRIKLSIG